MTKTNTDIDLSLWNACAAAAMTAKTPWLAGQALHHAMQARRQVLGPLTSRWWEARLLRGINDGRWPTDHASLHRQAVTQLVYHAAHMPNTELGITCVLSGPMRGSVVVTCPPVMQHVRFRSSHGVDYATGETVPSWQIWFHTAEESAEVVSTRDVDVAAEHVVRLGRIVHQDKQETRP